MGKIEKLLHKDREEIIGFCNRCDSIFIYGAGKVAKEMILYLEEEKIDIKGIVVGNGHRRETTYYGYSVFEIDNWKHGLSDGIILGIAWDKQEQVFHDLIYAGIDKEKIYFQKIFGRRILPWNPHAVTINKNDDGNFFALENELNELGIKYNTDKSSQYHNYLRKYEFFLKPYSNLVLNVLELGVFNGGSLNMCEE